MRGHFALERSMYAVIATGGKQYRVEQGSVLRIEKLAAEPGAEVKFDQVLLVGSGESVKVGTPLVTGAKQRPRDVKTLAVEAMLRLQQPEPQRMPGDHLLGSSEPVVGVHCRGELPAGGQPLTELTLRRRLAAHQHRVAQAGHPAIARLAGILNTEQLIRGPPCILLTAPAPGARSAAE